MSAIDDLTADVQEVPDVKAARRALIEYFTGNPDDEFDGPCSVVDAYAAAVRGEAEARIAVLERLVTEKNAVYSERNKAVAALAFMAVRAGFKAGTRQHEGDEWEADWRTVLFIDLPTGQVSWHFHDSEAGLLKGLPEYDGTWDGHSPEEKYARLDAYAAAVRGEAEAPIAAALDLQVLVVDGVEYEIYGTSAALEILGRALGVPEDAWKTVTIGPPIPLTQRSR